MDWYFSPNHLHFLFRTVQKPFSMVMRSIPGVGYVMEQGNIIAQDNHQLVNGKILTFLRASPLFTARTEHGPPI